MSFNTLLPNQCVSFNNLQDAVNQNLFIALQAIPESNEQITKQNFEDYVLNFGAANQYPPYVNTPQNQLVVKENIALYGSASLVPNYGITFVSISYTDFTYTSPVGLWTLPESSTQNVQYYNVGIVDYLGPLLFVEVNGTITSPSGYASVVLSVNGNVYAAGNFFEPSGSQAAFISLSSGSIYAPNNIELTIIDGQAVPINVTFQEANGAGIPITAVSMNRGSGQYQMVATGANGYAIGYLEGSLYRSIDYGATFQKSVNNTLYYWDKIAMSDTGEYMIAGSLNGPLMLSSNYGISFDDITTRMRGNATEYFEGIGMSGDGKYIIVCYEDEIGGTKKISNDYGASGSWSTVPGISKKPPINPIDGERIQGVAISNDGQYMYLSYTEAYVGVVYKSSDYGVTWQKTYPGTQYVRDISCSSDGSTVMVTGAVSGYGGTYLSRGFMFKSTNYGVSYTGIESGDYLRNWARVGQIYAHTTASSPYPGYGTVMTYLRDQAGDNTFPAETYPMGGDTLGSVVNTNTTGMGNRVFTDCAVGGAGGVYRLLASTTGLFRSVNGGGSWTKL
jgi:hypothetical protein